MNKIEKQLMQNLKENKACVIGNSRIQVYNESAALYYHETPVVIVGRDNDYIPSLTAEVSFNTGGY